MVFLAHRLTLVEQPFWGEVALPCAVIIAIGVLAIFWHHGSPSSTKRTPRFYAILSITTFLGMGVVLSLTHESIYGHSIDETIHDLAEKDPEFLESVLESMIHLSKESLVHRKERIILGSEKKQIPEVINRLSPHSIHLKKGEIRILLSKYAKKSLFLSLEKRAEDYYILLNLKNEETYITESRELYPYSRTKELVEPSRAHNSVLYVSYVVTLWRSKKN